jgi:hypothetical protein
MSEAILRLSAAGGEELARVLGNVRNTYRNVAQVVNAEARRAARERAQIERQAVQAIDRTTREQVRAAQRAEREVMRLDRERTRAALREAGQRQRAEERTQREVERAARTAARIAEAESRRKVKAVEREAKDVEKLILAQLAAREQAEKRATRAAEQESRRRVQLAETEARTIATASINAQQRRERAARGDRRETRQQWRGLGRAAWGAASGGAQAASAALGDALAQTHDAEQRRAVSQHAIYNMSRQTGANAAEAGRYSARLAQISEQHGIPMEVLAEAAVNAQGTFSSLAGDTAQARSQALERFISTALEAQTVSGVESIGQHTMLSGLVDQIGGSDEQRRATRLGIAHLTELGAIEETQLIQQGMPALMGQVGAAQGALPAGSTPEQIAQAGHRALIQGVAEMEVMRGVGGYSATASGNVFSNMGTALTSDVTQQRILNNINHGQGMTERQRNHVRQALFQTDRNGHSTLRGNLTDPVQFAAAAAEVLQDNPTAFQNLFAGGGHGNAQGLQANWRRLGARMFTRDEHGEAAFERIKRFAHASAEGISNEDMERRRSLTEADPMTRMVKQEERRLNALTQNNTALHDLNQTLQNFRANNPLLASQLAKTPYVGEAVEAAAARASEVVPYSSGTQREAIRDAIKHGEYNPFNAGSAEGAAERITSGRTRTATKASSDTKDAALANAIAQLPARVATAIQNAPLTATVSPTDAAHAVTTGAARPPQ